MDLRAGYSPRGDSWVLVLKGVGAWVPPSRLECCSCFHMSTVVRMPHTLEGRLRETGPGHRVAASEKLGDTAEMQRGAQGANQGAEAGQH